MNKEVLIICESTYNGNTQRLGKAMANQLNCLLVDAQEAEKLNLNNYTAIGWGSGIFFTRHASKLLEHAKKLEYNNQDVFIFSTHGSPILGKYHKELKDLLTTKGRTVIGEFSTRAYDCTGPFTLIGGGNKGKPNEKDQRKAAEFVKKLFPEFERKDYYNNIEYSASIKENKPNTYKVSVGSNELVLKGDLVTVNQNQCICCGNCIKKCPLNVFDLVDKKSVPVRELDCVQCKLCQSYCPSRAICVHGKWTDAIRVAKRHAHR